VLDEQGSRGQFKKIGIVNPSTASEPTHLTIVNLGFYDDISALHHRLRVAYEQVSSEQARFHFATPRKLGTQ